MHEATRATLPCSLARSPQIVGEWWTLLVLRHACFGRTGFEAIHDHLGIARNILKTRLDALVDHRMVDRRRYQSIHTDTSIYPPTAPAMSVWSMVSPRWSLLSSSMTDHVASSRDRARDSRTGAALRFLTELVAWIATPWALWSHSKLLAVASVVILIGLPTVFATPGDKAHVLVPVPGPVTIALNALQFIAAIIASWIAWPNVVASAVTLLVVAAAISQLSRWRWLLNAKG